MKWFLTFQVQLFAEGRERAKEKRGRCDGFSKSDFSEKQRRHLSEQRAVRTHREFRQLAPWQAPAFASCDLISRDPTYTVLWIKTGTVKPLLDEALTSGIIILTPVTNPLSYPFPLTQSCPLLSPFHKSLGELPDHKPPTQKTDLLHHHPCTVGETYV